jgi:hypothetical protein
MYRRSALTLVGLSLAAGTAIAANWVEIEGSDWAYDPTTAHVLRADPIERTVTNDRIVVDIRKQSDETEGTLRLDCLTNVYSIWMLGTNEVDQPTPGNPLAQRLADEFCPRMDSLPQADLLHPAETPNP